MRPARCSSTRSGPTGTRDGICNLVFELERSQKPVLSWGGNGDGRLDFPVKFLGASGDFKAGEGDGKLWIDSIRGEFVSALPPSRAVAVTLKGTEPFHLIPPEGQGPVLSFHNRSVSAVRLNAELTLRDFDGTAVRKRFPLVLAAGEKQPFTWPEKLGRPGHPHIWNAGSPIRKIPVIFRCGTVRLR